MDELDNWLRLVRVPGIHSDTLTSLLTRFGTLDAIFTASPLSLSQAGLTPLAVERLLNSDPAQLALDREWVDQPGNAFIPWATSGYPVLLAQLHSAPIGLFVRGNVTALSDLQLAVVGARNPTSAGRETAEAFAAHLASCGLTITSGLAAGIDAAAHRGALRAKGVTVAVCATGLDIVYPTDHRSLADAICERGALVSEFPPGAKPLKFHFPRRNRVISGLSLGTLVVEAAIHSGSLITAKLAADQGREVFAIPGSIHNPMARGCHQLLRQGATLVESTADILAELGSLAATLRGRESVANPDSARVSAAPLDKAYKMLLDALGFEPSSVDQLVARTGFKAEEVASMLLILELDGRVDSNPGALYSLASLADC